MLNINNISDISMVEYRKLPCMLNVEWPGMGTVNEDNTNCATIHPNLLETWMSWLGHKCCRLAKAVPAFAILDVTSCTTSLPGVFSLPSSLKLGDYF